MLNKVNFDKDLVIAQLWVGTAIFTKEILKKMSKNSKLYAFEIDKSCRKYIDKIQDERLTFIEDSAEHIDKYIKTDIDVIISTLPFASLPDELLNKVISVCKLKLKDEFLFLQYQYFLTDKKKIEKIFEKKSKLDLEIRNFPPAFIYEIKNNEFF